MFKLALPKKKIKLVEDFVIYYKAVKGRSSRTIEEYRYDLYLFFKFCIHSVTDIPIEDIVDYQLITDDFIKEITLEDLHAFIYYCEEERNNQAAAKSRKISALKAFFSYLTSKRKLLPVDIALDLEKPKIPNRKPVYLKQDECEQLYSGIKKENYFRDFCIVTLFLHCGLRVSELVSINLKDVKKEIISIIGKGNKERLVYLNKDCLQAIENYIEKERKIKDPSEQQEALFLSRKNQRISTRTIQIMIRNLNINSGVNKESLTPHKLRHSMATLLCQNGTDIRKLQVLLGHSSIATTEIYTHLEDDSLKKVIENHPLAKI